MMYATAKMQDAENRFTISKDAGSAGRTHKGVVKHGSAYKIRKSVHKR